MLATGKADAGEVGKKTDDKEMESIPSNNTATDEDIDVAISEDGDASSAPDADSTYNLEDDLTPLNVTPVEDLSESDSSGESVDDISSDSSAEMIIPRYFFYLPLLQSKNVEYNRCLLHKLDSVPASFWASEYNKRHTKEREAKRTNSPTASPQTSSSSDSSSSAPRTYSRKMSRRRVSRIAEGQDGDMDESDSEAKSEYSLATHCSFSLDSTESDAIIPGYLFRLAEEDIIRPELELCLDFDDDSRATEYDIQTEESFSAKLEENPEDVRVKDESSSRTSVSLDWTVFFEDDDDIIPRYMFS